MAVDSAALAVLTRTSRLVVAVVVRSLSSVVPQVTVVQIRVLVMVWGAETRTVTEIAEGLGVNPSSASRTCERLVRAGLLRRRQHDDDRRQAHITLSDAGRELVDSVMERRRADLAGLLAALSPGDQEHLRLGLEALTRAADRSDAGPDPRADHHLLEWLT